MTFIIPRQGGSTPPVSGGDCCFVFHDGGTAGGNVYTTMLTLETALLAVEGEKSIVVAVPTIIPAGTYDLNDAWWVGPLGAPIVMGTEDGVEITGCRGIRRGLIHESSNTADPVYRIAAGATFMIEDGALLRSRDATGQAIVFFPGAGSWLVLNAGGVIGNEDDPVVEIGAGVMLNLRLSMVSSFVTDHSLSGLGEVNPIGGGQGTMSRVQPLLTGLLDFQYALPSQNSYATVAAGQVPFASLQFGNAYVLATGPVSLPPAIESAGPHHIFASGGDRIVSLSDLSNTLQGTVAGVVTIPRDGFAVFKSDNDNAPGAWVVAASSGPPAAQYFAETLAMTAGANFFMMPTGMNSGDIVPPGGINTIWTRTTSGHFRRVIMAHSLGMAAGDVAVHAILNESGAPGVLLGTFPAALANETVELVIPLAGATSFGWVNLEDTQLTITSTLGIASGDIWVAVQEGWH